MKVGRACEIRDVLSKGRLSELLRVTPKSRTLDKKEMSGNCSERKRNQASGADKGYQTR